MTDFLLSKLKKATGITFGNIFLACFIILSMISVSIFFNNKEIILPEMAALAVGCLIYEHPAWISKPFHIFLLPSLTAVGGFLINKLDITMAEKLICVLLLMLLILHVFKSLLAPALATGLLPIITNSTSFSFILSILALTLVLYVSLKLKNDVAEETKVICRKKQTKYNILYLAFISSWILFCSYFGWIFMAAIPPVIVVGYESVHKKEYSFTVFYKQIICLFLAAFIGSKALYFIDNLVIVAFVDFILVSFLLRLLKFRMPPAYAMAILPMALHAFSYDYFYWRVLGMAVLILGSVYVYKNSSYQRFVDFELRKNS